MKEYFSDAAHVMLPFAGEGANMAMLDALELSECLTSDKYNTLQEAISFYEINMRKRAAMAAQESLENGKRVHSEGALNKMLNIYLADNKKGYLRYGDLTLNPISRLPLNFITNSVDRI